jgi:hypothetical protein
MYAMEAYGRTGYSVFGTRPCTATPITDWVFIQKLGAHEFIIRIIYEFCQRNKLEAM